MKPTFRFLAAIPFACAAALISLPSAVRAQTSVTTWAQTYGVGTLNPDNGGSLTGYDTPFGIAPMPDGGVVVVGELDLPSAARHGVLSPAGPGVLIRYNAAGATLWQVRMTVLNNADFLNPTDLANNTPGNVQAAAIRTDAQGNIYLSGAKNVSSDSGFERPFVAKFDANGALLWQNSLGYVTYHRTDADNQPVTNTALAGTSFLNFTITPDGGVVACTSVAVALYNTVHDSPLIAKFGPDGALQYVRAFDYPGQGTDSEPAFAACQSLDGSRILTLMSGGGAITQPGNITPTVAVLTDASGNIVAQRQFYLPDVSSFPAQAFATADGGWITYSQLAVYDSYKNYGAVLRKLHADLTPEWEKITSVPGYESYSVSFLASPTLTLTADGGFLLSGRIDGGYYGNVFGGYPLGSADSDVLLLKLDSRGSLQGAYQIGGPGADNIGEPPGRGPVGYPIATQTTDGGFVFTTPTFSYVTPTNASNAVDAVYPDWWTVKTDPNGRVQAFGDVQGSLPLSIFSVVDNTAASVAGGAFVVAGTAGYPQQGYAGVAVDSTPTFVAGTFNGAGDDHPNQQLQAGLFTGPVLPVTTNFSASAPNGLGAGQSVSFVAVQPSTAPGLTMRVQASTTPLIEGSWSTFGTMQNAGGGKWTFTTTNAPVTANTSRPDFYRAIAAAPGYHDSASMFNTATVHPAFFNGEVSLGSDTYYLSFPNGNIFGYYRYLEDPRYIYHFDMGYEYVFDLGNGGVVFYDFKSDDYFYTSPTFPFPYLYDFGLDAFLFYYSDPTNPQRYNTNGVRYFFNFKTGKIITK